MTKNSQQTRIKALDGLKALAIIAVVYQHVFAAIVIHRLNTDIVVGYGFGLRARVLGYFLRTDWAWGIDDKQVGPRIFYFSIGLDF